MRKRKKRNGQKENQRPEMGKRTPDHGRSGAGRSLGDGEGLIFQKKDAGGTGKKKICPFGTLKMVPRSPET